MAALVRQIGGMAAASRRSRLDALGMPLTNIVAIAQPGGNPADGRGGERVGLPIGGEEEQGLLVVQAPQLHHRIIRR